MVGLQWLQGVEAPLTVESRVVRDVLTHTRRRGVQSCSLFSFAFGTKTRCCVKVKARQKRQNVGWLFQEITDTMLRELRSLVDRKRHHCYATELYGRKVKTVAELVCT